MKFGLFKNAAVLFRGNTIRLLCKNIFTVPLLFDSFRTRIVDAEYLPLEIRNEPGTNCLQPTPIAKNWIKFCSKNDLYCYDFRNLCASSSGLQEQLNALKENIHGCVANDAIV